MIPVQMTQPSSSGSSMKILFVVLCPFRLISSGAQLGRSGICVAFGVVFFYFGSVVGPWLYLDDVMIYLCIVWSGDCKPTLCLFLIHYMGCCEDYLTWDIAFNAVMPLSRASTRGRYSLIEGVTGEDLRKRCGNILSANLTFSSLPTHTLCCSSICIAVI